MLDGGEFRRVTSLLEGGHSETQRERVFGPFLREYERITGFRETNPNAVFHHHLSLYGPPCSRCSKPLRTPHAKLCGSCMQPVVQAE